MYSGLINKSAYIFFALLLMLALTSAFPLSGLMILLYFGGSLLVLVQAFIILSDKQPISQSIGKDLNDPDELIDMKN